MSNTHQELLRNIGRQKRALTAGINVRPKFQPNDSICSPGLRQRLFPLHKLIRYICIHTCACTWIMYTVLYSVYVSKKWAEDNLQGTHHPFPAASLTQALTEQVSAREIGTKYILPLSIWLLSSLSGIRVMTISNIQMRGQGKCFKVT